MKFKVDNKTINNIKSWVLDNTDKNDDHNDCDGYIVLIRTRLWQHKLITFNKIVLTTLSIAVS